MPEPDGMREEIGENRARIAGLEEEVTRLRNRQHELAERVGIISWYGEKIDRLTREVHELAQQFATLARRAVEKPSATTWQTLAAVVATVVSVLALVLESRH